jgi:uncharacterized protein
MDISWESRLQSGLYAYEQDDYLESFKILFPLTQNTDEAIKWYRIAAQTGDIISQNNLASLILSEYPLEAISLYQCAAEKGLPFAQDTLGDIYAGILPSTGTNLIKKDLNIALRWYRKAVISGSPIACYRLAKMYEEGNGVVKSQKIAIEYYRKAAECGMKEAQEKLLNLDN